jgi:serine/threonine protein phosphatase 1
MMKAFWFRRRSKPEEQAVEAPAPRIPEGMRIYAVGDIHGRHDLLAARLAAIDRHRAAHPVARAVEVYLGDYIDRGADSRAVIELLLERLGRTEGHALAGNHEQLMLKALAEDEGLADWIRIGGVTTMASYGVAVPQRPDAERLAKALAELRAALPESHLAFLKRLGLTFVCGDYVFVHAGLRPGLPIAAQAEHDLLWIRDEFLNHRAMFEKVVIHGHSPVNEPEFRPNRINLDTAAFASGRLTCLVLEGAAAFILP